MPITLITPNPAVPGVSGPVRPADINQFARNPLGFSLTQRLMAQSGAYNLVDYTLGSAVQNCFATVPGSGLYTRFAVQFLAQTATPTFWWHVHTDSTAAVNTRHTGAGATSALTVCWALVREGVAIYNNVAGPHFTTAGTSDVSGRLRSAVGAAAGNTLRAVADGPDHDDPGAAGRVHRGRGRLRVGWDVTAGAEVKSQKSKV